MKDAKYAVGDLVLLPAFSADIGYPDDETSKNVFRITKTYWDDYQEAWMYDVIELRTRFFWHGFLENVVYPYTPDTVITLDGLYMGVEDLCV